MEIQRISAWEARRHLGKYMDEVVRTNRPIIIESHGKPKVAFVPIHLAEKYYSRKEDGLVSEQSAIQREAKREHPSAFESSDELSTSALSD